MDDLPAEAVTPPPIRVGVIADLLEERWPSMDLVADALVAHLEPLQARLGLQVTLVRPSMPARGVGIGRYVNRFWDYPRWIRRHASGFDVYHVIDHSYAHVVHTLPAERTVVTCHDVDAFMPMLRPGVIPTRLPAYFTRRVLAGLRKAAVVTCDTAATRDEVLEFNLLPSERLQVVHVGVQPGLLAEPEPDAAQAVEALAGARQPGVPELLHVGSGIPRKRIDILLRVLESVARHEPRVRLLKAGGRLSEEQWAMARTLGVDSRIVQLPFLDVDALAALYRRADVSLTTSDREGFGLPVAEALACGTPVVATDLPVLREVGGTAAAFVSLDDIDGWTRAVRTVLATRADNAARVQAAALGRTQAPRFTWTAFAARMAETYLNLAGRAQLGSSHQRVAS